MQWIEKPQLSSKESYQYAQKTGNSPFLSSLLWQRKIEDNASFLQPSLQKLHNPLLMQDMSKAVSRLKTAIENKEKILVYGDYDVDGTTSVSLFYGFLAHFHTAIEYYIPDRYKEGYGVSNQGIEYAHTHGFSLIVSIDCGIKAHEQVKNASEKGIDFIICDHHEPDEMLPNAVAILNPKRKDCAYPFKELCGCGVAFKFLQAYCLGTNQSTERLFEGLDLVAVATVADIVPIVDENRILVYHGLKKINQNPCFGIKALMNLTTYEGDFNAMNLAFGIAPRINAAGRIKHANYAVQVLLAKTAEEAEKYAQEIDEFNQHRKDLDAQITQEALQIIAENKPLQQAKTTVLYNENWHKGVIGIVASRCIEKYHRPTVILTKSDNKIVGSVRSILGIDIYKVLEKCQDVLTQFGGHQYAAGLTMKEENIIPFQEKFEEIVKNSFDKNQFLAQLNLDKGLNFEEIDNFLYEEMIKIAPFGPKNEEPVFYTEKVYLKKMNILKDKHLRLDVYQNDKKTMTALGFNMLSIAPYFEHGIPFKIAYTLQENEYKGQKKLQLMIKDIQF